MQQLTKYESFEELKSEADHFLLSKKQQKIAFAEFKNILTFFKSHIVNKEGKAIYKPFKIVL
jgi:hypothetical protein